MSETPVQSGLRAIDALDLDALMEQFAPDAKLTNVFGERLDGRDEVRAALGGFFAGLRATEHRVTDEWNPEPGVWIAELSATYELTDFSRRGPLMRAMIFRTGEAGIEELRIYGAHEQPLPDAVGGYQEVRGPHGWLPTL